jgi:hypothetical protein
MRSVLISLAVSTTLFVPMAARSATLVDPYCANVPRASWVSATEIRQDLQQRGLAVKEIRIGDQKCYTVRAVNERGQRKDLVVDPQTGTIMR